LSLTERAFLQLIQQPTGDFQPLPWRQLPQRRLNFQNTVHLAKYTRTIPLLREAFCNPRNSGSPCGLIERGANAGGGCRVTTPKAFGEGMGKGVCSLIPPPNAFGVPLPIFAFLPALSIIVLSRCASARDESIGKAGVWRERRGPAENSLHLLLAVP
jgi:hypothetical protein